MKKVFLVLLCGFFSLLFNMNAAPVSESEAKNVAEKFCERKGIAGELVLSDVRRTGCYIFNSSKGGFVIVSSDDKVTPIWGYSKTGSIQKRDESSSSFYGWLNSVDESVDSLASLIDDSQVDKAKWSQLRSGWSGSSLRSARFVTPFVSTTWHQEAPFNQMCPENSLAGCIAIAMAQVMKYYEYPKQGVGATEEYVTLTNRYEIPSVKLDVEYDWDNMLDSYREAFSQVEADAVSELVYHCGAATLMDYDPKMSGSNLRVANKAFYNYFDYDKSLRLIRREFFSDEQWHAILKEQLDKGRPIIYSGSDEQGVNGHAFVCDGYDEENFYHFNFGWDGELDGYFSIDFIVPTFGLDGGSVRDFSFNHEALVDIFPNQNGSYAYDFLYLLPEHFTISEDTVSAAGEVVLHSELSNLGIESFEGVLFLELSDTLGHSYGVIFEDTVFIDGIASHEMNIVFDYGNVPNGVYQLSFGLRGFDGRIYKVREVEDSVAYRRFVVDLPSENPSAAYDFYFDAPEDFTVSPDTAVSNDLIDVTGKFINKSKKAFRGKLLLEITDTDGIEVTRLEGDTIDIDAMGGYYFKWSFYLSDVPEGLYHFEVVLRDAEGGEYRVKDKGDTLGVRDFWVEPSVLPAVPDCRFELHQYSDYTVTVASSEEEGTSLVTEFNIYNSGEDDFNGVLYFEFLDSVGNVVGELESKGLMKIVAGEQYRSGLNIIVNDFPKGEFSLVLKLKNESGVIFSVKDEDETEAKRAFVLGELTEEVLSLSDDHSLVVSATENGLYLSSAEKQPVVIYDLNGRVIRELVLDGSLYLQLPSGCYLVKSKDSVVKIVL
jgi:hypothetical protein